MVITGSIVIVAPNVVVVIVVIAVIVVIVVVVVVIVVGSITNPSVLRVTSVLIKNVKFKIFLKSDYGSCFLNILRNSIPYHWSRNLYHFTAINIIRSFGVKRKGLLNMTNIKITFPTSVLTLVVWSCISWAYWNQLSKIAGLSKVNVEYT